MTPSSPDACLDALLREFGSEGVLSDETARREYSTDASPCFVVPGAVVHPRSEAEVVRTLRICSEHAVPVTPRAAGTSLSGAAIGPGVVMDRSRLDAIRELDGAQRWVRVEPGVRIADLNAFLRERGFRFPLERGSREWCRIDGMVGHNASGYAGVKYGQTRAASRPANPCDLHRRTFKPRCAWQGLRRPRVYAAYRLPT